MNVITYGTFDLTHPGHINLLKNAKNLGDKLFVGVSTDYFNKIKNKKSFFDYNHRKIIIESLRFVDFVFEENSWDQKIEDIKKYKIDIFTIGDDWLGKFDFLEKENICKVIYIPRYPEISTTTLKKIIK